MAIYIGRTPAIFIHKWLNLPRLDCRVDAEILVKNACIFALAPIETSAQRGVADAFDCFLDRLANLS